MRMSCNGCRVLRKGCSDNCSIRPCLQWIKNSDSQANATVFLAKFYGRAGLLNLINAGPEHLRPAIFRSLLYEACGRIVNPIYGSVGLLWSGSWQLCHSAVEGVLKGTPIIQIASESAANPSPPINAYDIRHVSKEENQEIHRVKTRSRFKRLARRPKAKLDSAPESITELAEYSADPESHPVHELRWGQDPSGNSSLSHQSELNAETESAFSVDTVEGSLAGRVEPEPNSRTDYSKLELELTLGVGRVSHAM